MARADRFQPSACSDCPNTEAKPGPVPALVKESDSQRVYRCPACGHDHYVGLEVEG